MIAEGSQKRIQFISSKLDFSRKKLVPKDGTVHSAIYYYPGYFRTKLVVDNAVVKSTILDYFERMAVPAEDDSAALFQKRRMHPG